MAVPGTNGNAVTGQADYVVFTDTAPHTKENPETAIASQVYQDAATEMMAARVVSTGTTRAVVAQPKLESSPAPQEETGWGAALIGGALILGGAAIAIGSSGTLSAVGYGMALTGIAMFVGGCGGGDGVVASQDGCALENDLPAIVVPGDPAQYGTCTPDRALTHLADGGTLYLQTNPETGTAQFQLQDSLDLTGKSNVTVCGTSDQDEDGDGALSCGGVSPEDVVLNLPVGTPGVISGEDSVENALYGLTLDGSGQIDDACITVSGGLSSLTDDDGNGVPDTFFGAVGYGSSAYSPYDYVASYPESANLYAQSVICRDAVEGLDLQDSSVLLNHVTFENMRPGDPESEDVAGYAVNVGAGGVLGAKAVRVSDSSGSVRGAFNVSGATAVIMDRTVVNGVKTDNPGVVGGSPLIGVYDTKLFAMMGGTVCANEGVDGPAFDVNTTDQSDITAGTTDLQSSMIMNTLVCENHLTDQVFNLTSKDGGGLVWGNNTVSNNQAIGDEWESATDDEGNEMPVPPMLDRLGTVDTNYSESGSDKGSVTLTNGVYAYNSVETETVAGINPEADATIKYSAFWQNNLVSTLPTGDYLTNSEDPGFSGSQYYSQASGLDVESYYTTNTALVGDIDSEMSEECTSDEALMGYDHGPYVANVTVNNSCSDEIRPDLTVEDMVQTEWYEQNYSAYGSEGAEASSGGSDTGAE